MSTTANRQRTIRILWAVCGLLAAAWVAGLIILQPWTVLTDDQQQEGEPDVAGMAACHEHRFKAETEMREAFEGYVPSTPSGIEIPDPGNHLPDFGIQTGIGPLECEYYRSYEVISSHDGASRGTALVSVTYQAGKEVTD